METGLYYYGARYLDPKISRWLSGDPAVGEYIPSAPVNDEARKRNQSLPGMGGVFNYVNLHVYHYGGNNPVKLVDPDGRDIIILGNKVSQAIDYLYSNSNTFKFRFKRLLNNRNSLGERLVVYIREREGTYPGLTQTDTDNSLMTITGMQTIDEDGNLQYTGSLEMGERVQAIFIDIDTRKIEERNLDFLEVLTEEIMYAADAARMGSEVFNEEAIREERNFRYVERPFEIIAKDWTQKILRELQ